MVNCSVKAVVRELHGLFSCQLSLPLVEETEATDHFLQLVFLDRSVAELAFLEDGYGEVAKGAI